MKRFVDRDQRQRCGDRLVRRVWMMLQILGLAASDGAVVLDEANEIVAAHQTSIRPEQAPRQVSPAVKLRGDVP